MLLAVVNLAGLLSRMFARALEAAQPPLGILFRQGSASSCARLLTQVRLDRGAGFWLIAGRNGRGVFFLVMGHAFLLCDWVP